MVQRAQQELPDLWPQTRLEVHFENDHYTLPWSSFPKLEQEIDTMLAELTGESGAGRRRKGARLARSTAHRRKYSVQRVVSAWVLVKQVEPGTIRTLAQVVEPDLVENFIDFMLARRGRDNTGDLSQVCRHLNSIARFHTSTPKETLEDLVQIRRTVLRPHGPAEKNKKLMLMFHDPQLRTAFLMMPRAVST